MSGAHESGPRVPKNAAGVSLFMMSHSSRATTRAAGGNVSKTIEDACQAAAIEDGVLTPGQRVADPPAKASKAKNGLRRWVKNVTLRNHARFHNFVCEQLRGQWWFGS